MSVIYLTDRSRSRGFTFTEILFAVMILGIGFIMVAAMFPVAIQQTQSTTQETVVAGIAREGATYVSKIASSATMPPTFPRDGSYFRPQQPGGLIQANLVLVVPGEVFTFRDPRLAQLDPQILPLLTAQMGPEPLTTWASVNHNLILPSDNRFAWYPMYRRDIIWHTVNGTSWTPSLAPYAQVIVIGVQNRNQSAYDDTKTANAAFPDVQASPLVAAKPGTFEPAQGFAMITAEKPAAGQPSTIQFQNPNADVTRRAAEGAFVVISSDGQRLLANEDPRQPTPRYRSMNGSVLRLGNSLGNNKFELAPGQGLAQGQVRGDVLNRATVLVIGRGYRSPAQGVFEGPAQDVAVYTTIVQVN